MGESFLDFRDEDLDGATEPQAVEGGEYTIKISDWKADKKGAILQRDKNDEPYIMPIFEVIECEESEFAKNFSHFLRIPHKDMNVKDRNAARWDMKSFCTCFSIDYSQRIDYEDCIGKTGEALLLVSPDEGFGEQNRVKKFMSPR